MLMPPDADNTNNCARRTNHDYIASFGKIPNEPKNIEMGNTATLPLKSMLHFNAQIQAGMCTLHLNGSVQCMLSLMSLYVTLKAFIFSV